MRHEHPPTAVAGQPQRIKRIPEAAANAGKSGCSSSCACAAEPSCAFCFHRDVSAAFARCFALPCCPLALTLVPKRSALTPRSILPVGGPDTSPTCCQSPAEAHGVPISTNAPSSVSMPAAEQAGTHESPPQSTCLAAGEAPHGDDHLCCSRVLGGWRVLTPGSPGVRICGQHHEQPCFQAG